MSEMNYYVSSLKKTWILDIDGTIVKHNGYKIDGYDTLLEGAVEFIKNISPDDMIIFVTSRKEEYRESTIDFLNKNKIRFDHIIFSAPYGERILVNDRKPSGLDMAIAINLERDKPVNINIKVDETL